MNMPVTEIRRQLLTGERALFQGRDLAIYDTIFDDGESPLKESRNITLSGCLFRWKYPLWYAEHIRMAHCTLFEMGRAGIWYTKHLTAEHIVIEAPKTFRRCEDLTLRDVQLTHAQETLWSCTDVRIADCTVNGDYFGMNCTDLEIDGLTVVGNYAFDGVKRAVIRNARLLTKDAFWNTEDVTVYDSFISGEYLGWNAKRLTLVNCTVESLQGLCYIDTLVMRNCKLLNTTLAFEYSTVDAEINGHIDSVKNPSGGILHAGSIGELILEPDKVDPAATQILTETH